jgi:hypothetical protein
LARCQVLYRRNFQFNSSVNWKLKEPPASSYKVRLDRTGVHTRYLDTPQKSIEDLTFITNGRRNNNIHQWLQNEASIASHYLQHVTLTIIPPRCVMSFSGLCRAKTRVQDIIPDGNNKRADRGFRLPPNRLPCGASPASPLPSSCPPSGRSFSLPLDSTVPRLPEIRRFSPRFVPYSHRPFIFIYLTRFRITSSLTGTLRGQQFRYPSPVLYIFWSRVFQYTNRKYRAV